LLVADDRHVAESIQRPRSGRVPVQPDHLARRAGDRSTGQRPAATHLMMAAMKPSGRRVAVAAVAAAVGLLAAGLLWFGLPLGGALGQRFTGGEPVTVQLDDGRFYMIWTPDGTEPHCQLLPADESAPGNAEFIYEPDAVDLDAAGESWRGTTRIRVNPAGAYRLTCDTSGALGEPPRGYGARARAITAIAALSLAATGLLAGAFVALRRSTARA
jgi:hypothetical protein